MNKKIKKGNLNFDQSGRAYPDNPHIEENWDCIWEYEGKNYKLVGDDYHKEWEQVNFMNKEQQELLNEAHNNYLNKCLDKKWMKENVFFDGSSNHHLYLQQEFINKCKTDTEFSERWGLKVEERELSVGEINEIRDMQYFKNSLHQALKGSDTKIDWENIPTKLTTVTYNNKTIESYE